MGTAHLLEILAHGRHRPRKLIVASSMSIYGEGAYRTPGGEVVYPMLRSERTLQQRDWDRFDPFVDLLTPLPTDEEKPLRPTSIYAVSKRDQEEMCLSVGRAYGIPTVAFRFFNVYGPRQALSNPYTGVAAIFSGRLLNGKAPVIFEDGRQGRDFINVKDIVQGLLLPLESDAADYEPINLGTGRCISVLDVAQTLVGQLGVEVDAAHQPAVPRRRHPVLLRRHRQGPAAARLCAHGHLRSRHGGADRVAPDPDCGRSGGHRLGGTGGPRPDAVSTLPPRIVAVVLNTNRRDDTLACLDSLAGLDYANHAVVVLDNASTDGSTAAIRAAHPEVRILPLAENRGYAGNNNVGIAAALEMGADWVLVLNEDTILDPACYTELMRAAGAIRRSASSGRWSTTTTSRR